MDGTSSYDKDNQSVQITKGVNQLANAMDKIANKYIETPTKDHFWKKKEFWSALVIAAGLTGYWVNWRQEIKNMEVKQLQSQIELIEGQSRELSMALTKPRILLLNQALLCPEISKAQLIEMKKERNLALGDIIPKALWISQEIDHKIRVIEDKIIHTVYKIDNICDIDSTAIDKKLRGYNSEIAIIINNRLSDYYGKLNNIEKSTIL